MIFRILILVSLSFSLFAIEPSARKEIIEKKKALEEKYLQARDLYETQGEEANYQQLLQQIQQIRKEIDQKEKEEKEKNLESDEEVYGFWDQGETSISQLLLEYGSTDYLYIIPQELSHFKMHLYSSIPIPRDCWDEMLELVLKSFGIGLKKINPYTKVLYILKYNPSHVEAICKSKDELALLSPSARAFYVFNPDVEDLRSLQYFFERFADPKETIVHIIGGQTIIVSSRENIEKLLSLYEAVWSEENSKKDIKVLPLTKLSVEEAEKILRGFFPDQNLKGRPYSPSGEELIVYPLKGSLAVIGCSTAIEKAETVLADLESQMEDPKEMTTFWYACKHSDPEELAKVLRQVYQSISSKKSGDIDKKQFKNSQGEHSNFIVDGKVGAILMVVRKEDVSHLKELVKKLDVPKKMVQIEVLLVEKKHKDRKRLGLNLLKLGGNATQEKKWGTHFDTQPRAVHKGIFDFLFSHTSKRFPSIDLSYSFLMAQDNVQINANPSVLAVNQTPATISIVEEISINNGAVPVEGSNNVTFEKSFTRAQYGTTIVLTPTIHLSQDAVDDQGFITLATNVTFETTEISDNDRPPVTRRHIENEVRVADGETIILGGLRRKSKEQKSEKIPFLGEIPGVGKLFGMNKHSDIHTEMFIFITPKIVKDPIEDLREIRIQELKKRPGDIPEFLEVLQQSKEKEKEKLFAESLQLILNDE